jgi:hypothetical protein
VFVEQPAAMCYSEIRPPAALAAVPRSSAQVR